MKKIKCILTIIFTLISIQNITFAIEPTKIIDITNKNISYTGGCHNNVMIINDGYSVKYFKETKKKLEIHDEINRTINEYFDDIVQDKNYNEDKNLLLNCILIEDNFYKFINMGNFINPKSQLWKFFHNEISLIDLGINLKNSKISKDILIEFLKYTSREICQYKINKHIEIGNIQDELAKNELATSKMANLLGVSDIIAHVEYVKLIRKEKEEKIGILIDEAKGIKAYKIKNINNKIILPIFQLKINNLEILDFICRQTDHSPWNYCVNISKKNEIKSLTAFDNDNSFDLETNLKEGFWHSNAPIINNKDMINLPYMNKKLANNILSLNDSEIKNSLKDLLSYKQIIALCKRINAIKKSIKKTFYNNKNFLIDESEYSQESILKEINGEFGNTYLNNFLNITQKSP